MNENPSKALEELRAHAKLQMVMFRGEPHGDRQELILEQLSLIVVWANQGLEIMRKIDKASQELDKLVELYYLGKSLGED